MSRFLSPGLCAQKSKKLSTFENFENPRRATKNLGNSEMFDALLGYGYDRFPSLENQRHTYSQGLILATVHPLLEMIGVQ